MLDSLIEVIPDYLETYKNDPKVTELLLQLGHHLDAREYENRINALAQDVFKFGEKEIAIYSVLKEPKDFLKGLDDAAALIGFYFNILKKSHCPSRDRDFVYARLQAAITAAESPDYKPYFQQAIWEQQAEDANDILRINAKLRRSGIAQQIKAVKELIENAQKRIEDIDHTLIDQNEAKARNELYMVEQAEDEFKRTRILPDDFVINDMFKGYPLEQFAFNKRKIESKILAASSQLTSETNELSRLRQTLAVYEKELASLGKVEHLKIQEDASVELAEGDDAGGITDSDLSVLNKFCQTLNAEI